jgi:hypothetical protein
MASSQKTLLYFFCSTSGILPLLGEGNRRSEVGFPGEYLSDDLCLASPCSHIWWLVPSSDQSDVSSHLLIQRSDQRKLPSLSEK